MVKIEKINLNVKVKVHSNLAHWLAEAEKLRKKANQSGKKWQRLVSEWVSTNNAEPDSAKRKQNDKIYGAKSQQLEEQENQDYAAYYQYVHSVFTSAEIVAAGGHGKFMDKSFISNLDKLNKDKLNAKLKDKRSKK